MTVECICEHSVDTALLPERPVILDVGCRDYRWSLAMLALRPDARIIACDADPALPAPPDGRIGVVNAAITSLPLPSVIWQGPGEGSYIPSLVTGNGEKGWPVLDMDHAAVVSNYSIEHIMRSNQVEFWDVVKLDCEGSEFNILENWPGPIARQISVEFHDQMDPERWDTRYFAELFGGPLRDYELAKFALSKLAPDSTLGWGHWDTLLILKE